MFYNIFVYAYNNVEANKPSVVLRDCCVAFSDYTHPHIRKRNTKSRCGFSVRSGRGEAHGFVVANVGYIVRRRPYVWYYRVTSRRSFSVETLVRNQIGEI